MSAEPGSSLSRRCAVLGSPIAHSLSPALHRAAYAELGLDWEYDAYDVSEAELPGFVATLAPDVRGLSLTMPLKTAVIPLCDAVSRMGALLGSVNTLLIEPDQTRSGHNTDVPGLVAALHEAGVDRVRSASLVGAGATAASALAAVAALGASSAEVLVRNVVRAARLVDVGDRLGVTVEVRHLDEVLPLDEARTPALVDLLVSTIPAAAQAPYAAALARRAEIVVDAIYDPARTPLLAAGEAAGARLVPGFALLLHQAARQVELMTGCEAAPLEAMRAAGLAALAAR